MLRGIRTVGVHTSLSTPRRAMSVERWATMARSAGAAKSKEQRDVERRRRQIEKLPSPIATNDLEYPYEKTVLCDQHFQQPVYEDHFDTPELFNLVPPDEFFVHWNIRDCGRTVYPPLPEMDHRTMIPGDHQDWIRHRQVAIEYLEKHQVVPYVFPSCSQAVNLDVRFAGDDDANSFWKSFHYGNFIELKDLQRAPSISILSAQGSSALHTVMLVSPDFPSRGSPHEGFVLHYAACNVSKQATAADVVADWIPPLPIEGAGCARILAVAFEQRSRVDVSDLELALQDRLNFRLGSREFPRWMEVERQLGDPSAITMCQTTWDIQVQEWFERHGLTEPTYDADDLDNIIKLNALPKERFQIQQKTRPDGSTDKDGRIEFNQLGDTVLHRRSATHLLSSRSMLSKDRKRYTRIH